ncbi:MAG: hypothetical protein MK161_06875 [Pirellulales bacterium]|nr:hypothetical protein [Pirellulales bacterium]
MNIKTQFQQKFASVGSGGPVAITVDVECRHLTCRLAECNPLAVSLDEIRLTSDELATAAVTDLQQLCEAISARLTYLLEPIAPIESDQQECVVQMRSSPPQQDDDGQNYYELLVRRGGGLYLARYRKEPGGARQQVATTVTGEVLVRLVGDFNTILDEFVAT